MNHSVISERSGVQLHGFQFPASVNAESRTDHHALSISSAPAQTPRHRQRSVVLLPAAPREGSERRVSISSPRTLLSHKDGSPLAASRSSSSSQKPQPPVPLRASFSQSNLSSSFSMPSSPRTLEGRRQSMRAFDSATGELVAVGERRPDAGKLTLQLYRDWREDTARLMEARRRVERMPLEAQILLAARRLQRSVYGRVRRYCAAGVLEPDANEGRARAAVHVEMEDVTSHIGKDTEQLSRIRVARRAVDQLLYEAACSEAAQRIAAIEERLLPASLPPLELLKLRLDAIRHECVPPPPRNTVAVALLQPLSPPAQLRM